MIVDDRVVIIGSANIKFVRCFSPCVFADYDTANGLCLVIVTRS